MMNRIVKEDIINITSRPLPWNYLGGRNILITGASGMLASYMVETILYLNDTKLTDKAKVYALVRNLEKAEVRFSQYLGRDDLIFVVQDVSDPINITEKLDYIIHAASHANPKSYAEKPVDTLTPNIIGTYNCLELAKKHDVRALLYFSSAEIYGVVKNQDTPLNEYSYGVVDPLDPRASYAESKRMGETMCIAWWRQYGVKTKIVRPFHTYGPYMPLGDGRIFSDFVANILNKKTLQIKGDGSSVRSFCYIADATIAFFSILLLGDAGEAYNVSGDRETHLSVFQLARELQNTFPEYRLKILKKNEPSLSNKVIPDIKKIRIDLGWYPLVSVSKGFRRTVESFNYDRQKPI